MARGTPKRILTGLKEIDRQLERLKVGGANRVARAGLVKGVRVLVRGMKSETSEKDVKKALGGKVKKDRLTSDVSAKAGAGVGKKMPKREDNRKSGGMGITPSNVHWFVQGTKKRTQEKTGRQTGKMPAHAVVKQGAAKSLPAARAAVREGCKVALARELAKAKK